MVKPGNPKLRHWHFGILRQSISDYHHAYVIAAHVYMKEERENLDLFFIDPVALSSRPLGTLRKKDISSLIDAASKDNHFFNIKRYGEDFVARKHGPSDPVDAAIPGPNGGAEDIVSFDSLLGDR